MIDVNKLSRDELIQLMDSASRRLNELSYANGYKDGHADGMEAERNRRSIMAANIIQKIDDLRTNYTTSSCNWLIADALDIIRDNIEGG